jgi:hypothetical protein
LEFRFAKHGQHLVEPDDEAAGLQNLGALCNRPAEPCRTGGASGKCTG